MVTTVTRTCHGKYSDQPVRHKKTGGITAGFFVLIL